MVLKYELCLGFFNLIKQCVSLMTFVGLITLVLCYFFMSYMTSFEIDWDIVLEMLACMISEEMHLPDQPTRTDDGGKCVSILAGPFVNFDKALYAFALQPVLQRMLFVEHTRLGRSVDWFYDDWYYSNMRHVMYVNHCKEYIHYREYQITVANIVYRTFQKVRFMWIILNYDICCVGVMYSGE
jgi:hypothetical protein